VITCGANGAIASSRIGQDFPTEMVEGIQTSVADTVGAGDAFCAGFIDAWLNTEPLLSCLTRGNRLGALAASKAGGTSAFTSGEIAAASAY
jgi:sugar/nucleoside kinase (ribokinase family)